MLSNYFCQVYTSGVLNPNIAINFQVHIEPLFYQDYLQIPNIIYKGNIEQHRFIPISL